MPTSSQESARAGRLTMTEQLFFAVTETSQVAEVRRQVVALAGKLGFSETDSGKVAIVATEVATNLAKHAVEGEIVVRCVAAPSKTGIEILALDKGPGIMNIAQSLSDGYSTAGSPGTGMGAISRLATQFDLHSVPKKGTAVMARIWPGRSVEATSPALLDVGVVCRAMRNEVICGDGWQAVSLPGRKLLLVVDGLGHGLGASIAAQEAIRIFRANLDQNPARIVESTHAALRPTRGAVIGIAEFALSERVIRYAGVGNISGAIVDGSTTRHLVSTMGTLGHDVRKVQEFSYPFPDRALLVLHSDGLTARWNLEAYPGLSVKAPSLIAGVLYRDCQRVHDDVTVLAASSAALEEPSWSV